MKSVAKEIPRSKIKTVEELTTLIKSKRTILVADISNIPCSQYQSISKKLRGKATIKVPKRNLFLRALENANIENAKALKNFLRGAVAILFSDLDPYDLARELIKNKIPAKAKPGQIAPEDLEVPAGPTDLAPGPAISELGALGIQIVIQGGKIEIKEPKVIVKKGEPIKPNAAEMLGKLGIQPFKIGFNPVSAYDSKEDFLYTEIIIDPEGILADLIDAYSKSLSFAVQVGYFSPDTLPFILRMASVHEKRLLRIISGEPEESEEPETTLVQEETSKEQTKEESKADTTAGLSALFG